MKKILSILITMIMLFSLCSCTKAPVPKGAEAVPQTSPTVEMTAKPTPTPDNSPQKPRRHSDGIDHNSFEASQKAEPRKETEIDRQILKSAEERKQAIRATKTNVEFTGTAYYVSADGNDKASGKSESEPWKSIAKLNKTKLKPGDAVFFKRGDTWRGECLELKAGVTYSAYGEGDKPAIYGSPENGTGAEKWELLEGTNNIWVFHEEMPECGCVVLNDEIWAQKVNPYLAGKKFTMPDGSGDAFDVKKALSSDLTFYSEDDTFVVYHNAFEGQRHEGKLYLRCDKGNPGEVYSSIEFCPWTNTNGGKGLLYTREVESVGLIRDVITVDNLTIKYTGGYGMYLFGSSALVQNCEVGWIGGCTTNYFASDFFGGSGNCIGSYGDVDNYSVRNCYLYQAYDSGISSEQSDYGEGCQQNITFEDNLIEDCLFGIEFYVGDENTDAPSVALENVAVKGNYILNTGNGFGSKRQMRRWNIYDAALMFHPYYEDMKNVVVSGNVLYKSGNYIVLCGTKKKPTFAGNTFVQENKGGLCLWGVENNGVRGLDEYLYDEKAERIVHEIIGDRTAAVAPLSE